MPDDLTPQEERDLVAPRRLFGQDSYPGEYEGIARDRAGVFSSFGRSFGHEASNAWRRWKSPTSVGDGEITEGELKAIAPGRNIPWEPGMTRMRAERLAADYDYQQYSSYYTQSFGSKAGEIAGWFAGGFLDPVSVVTMPIGGPEFSAALKAGATLKSFLYQGFKGASKVAAVSTPLEVGVQTLGEGRMSPQDIIATAAAPYVLGGALLGAGRIASGGGRRALANFADSPHTDLEAPSRALNESPDIPPPPVRQYDPQEMMRADLARTTDILKESGGSGKWLSDLAAGKVEAIDAAKRMGIDPDAPSIRSLIERQAYFTTSRTPEPAGQRLQDVADLKDMVAGTATPEQLQRLTDRGLVDEAPAASAVDAPSQQAERFTTKPELAALSDALRVPEFDRTQAQRIAVDDFMRGGTDGVKAKRLDGLQSEFKQLSESLGEIEAKGGGGAAPVRAKVKALSEEISKAGGDLRRVDQNVPLDELLGALSAARVEAPTMPPLPEPARDMGAAITSTVAPDATLDDVRKWAKEIVKEGEVIDSAEELVGKLDRAMKACGVT